MIDTITTHQHTPATLSHHQLALINFFTITSSRLLKNKTANGLKKTKP